MAPVQRPDWHPIEQTPEQIHPDEVVDDEGSQFRVGAELSGGQPNNCTKDHPNGGPGPCHQGSLAGSECSGLDGPPSQAAQPIQLNRNSGPHASRRQGVAVLVNQDREEDDGDPQQDLNWLLTTEKTQQGSHQEEGSSDGDRDSEKREANQGVPYCPIPEITGSGAGTLRFMHDDLKAAVAADMPRLKELLGTLIRMPSVSADGFDPKEVRATGESLVEILDEYGFQNTQLLESSTGHPAVFGELPAPEGAPTVLLYAHYDVQPPGPAEEWDTPPFEPVEKDGRIHGRGSADDKAGIVMHLGAIAAHGDALPVGVQLFFEGEEEAGSGGLDEILKKHSDLLKPDVIIIGDGGLWNVDTPAIMSSLRGLAAVKLELRTLHSAVHSGQAGGVVPDALMAMSRLLATLHDDQGNVAIEGLVAEEVGSSVDYPESLVRRETQALDTTELTGSGSLPSRLWTRPALSILAIDAPKVSEAINQLVPVARAKVSMRIPPGQDSKAALSALKNHLEANVPWGATLEFFHEEVGEPTTLDTDNFAVAAWRQAFGEIFPNEMVAMGAGGSIPFIATFKELYPNAPILVTGVSDPTSAYHAPNENMGIEPLERATVSEAIAFRLLAEG